MFRILWKARWLFVCPRWAEKRRNMAEVADEHITPYNFITHLEKIITYKEKEEKDIYRQQR